MMENIAFFRSLIFIYCTEVNFFALSFKILRYIRRQYYINFSNSREDIRVLLLTEV
jgi:hypothetical protein